MPKILIADDEPSLRILLQQSLEELEDDGVEIIVVENGKDALDGITNDHPELVFLDVMMPEMDGFEVCQTVKSELGMRDVCIVMLTAKGQEFDKQRGKEVGADVYMTKPFNPDELLAKAREVLGM